MVCVIDLPDFYLDPSSSGIRSQLFSFSRTVPANAAHSTFVGTDGQFGWVVAVGGRRHGGAIRYRA